MAKGSTSIGSYTKLFAKGLPDTKTILALLVFISFIFSIASVALANHQLIDTNFIDIAINGFTVGIIAIILPTILAAVFIKLALRKVSARHLLFISFISSVAFSMYLLLGSIIYILLGTAIAVLVIIVGTASIFGWQMIVNKILLPKYKRIVPLALVQPTLYLLFYIPTSKFVFGIYEPTGLLLIKLYAGIAVFAVVIYAIIYTFNKPMKRSLGFGSIDAFSEMLQDWLFGISTASSFSRYGKAMDIPVDVVLLNGKKGPKAMFFVPNLHYGVAGNIGGSNFPYLLEKYAVSRYKLRPFIMHTAVNEDFNPVNSMDIYKLKKVMNDAVREARYVHCPMQASFGESGKAKVMELTFDGVSMVTLTRAPNVTEDVSADAAILFKELISAKYDDGRHVVLIDAHNSRYETAPEKELDGIRMGTEFADEYVQAIKNAREIHKAASVKLGTSGVELYNALSAPKDLAMGSLNVAIFAFNGYKRAMLQFNANNMMPSLKTAITTHLHSKYGIDAEVYTTDTHAVNSLSKPASVVLGRHTRFKELRPFIDRAVEEALGNIEPVTVWHKQYVMKNFLVWGQNSRDRIFTVLRSIMTLARILVPAIIVAGFLAAAWVILLI